MCGYAFLKENSPPSRMINDTDLQPAIFLRQQTPIGIQSTLWHLTIAIGKSTFPLTHERHVALK